jgi:hypothetical protein
MDLVIFQTRCLTRVDGISPNLEATLSPHFSDPMNFLSLFLGYSRLHLALSILFVVGLPFAIKERNRNGLALYLLLFAGIVFTNLCVTAVSLRYQYWLLPLWILLALYGTQALLRSVQDLVVRGTGVATRHGWVTPALVGLGFLVAVLAFSPWRLAGAYDTKILGDAASAFSFVRTQLRAGDAVMATEPHPHAGLLETGRITYDLSVPMLYDFVYAKNGRVIDRNGGALAVSTLGELQAACAAHRRLWVLVNREKFRSRGANIRWEYPGARMELFLRQNLEVKFHSYLWDVYLWDADRGVWRGFRNDGV